MSYIIPVAFAFIATSAVIWLNRTFPTSQWHPDRRMWRRQVRLIDGTESADDLMCRKVAGHWEYRKMTVQERESILESDVI